MQQYRVNYTLLIGLIVGTMICSGVVFGVWKYQINRNAGALIEEAEKNLAAEDYRDAAQNFGNYLTIRTDDDEARVQWANAWADVTTQPSMAPEDLMQAIAVMEEVVRMLPEEKELQRRLVDLYGKYNQVQEAIEHLDLMQAKYPDDAELQVLRMQYLARAQKYDDVRGVCAKLIGYDEAEDAFDTDKAVAPHEAAAYGTFAAVLRTEEEDPDLADRVMEQLIEVNPESPEAYLQRGRYFISFDEEERGRRDIEKAYSMAPEDTDVLLAMAERAESNEDLDKAREYLVAANEKDPDDPRFYQSLASLDMKEQNYEAAMALIEKGLKEVPAESGNILLAYKVDLQFLANDVDGVKQTIDVMRREGFRPEYIEYVQARILLAQGKWFEASRALERIRPKLSGLGGLGEQVIYQLGICYERLGRLDQAMEQYDIILQSNPANEPAQAGKNRIAAVLRPSEGAASDLDARIAEIMEQPEESRDWTGVDEALNKFAEDRKLEGADLDLFWAKVMLMRKDYEAARRHLVEGRKKDPENLAIQRTAVALLRLDPSQGPARAMQLLDQVESRFGDQAGLRLDRADLLIALNEDEPNKDQLKEQLTKLAEPPADWSKEDSAGLLSGMAGKYLSLGMRDESRILLERVSEVRADDLPTRVTLFSLALEANDDVGMRAAQDKILEIVGTKSDSTWLFTEARRMLSLYRRGELDRESLDEVRGLVDKAFQQRPDWFELHLVKAEIELLDGNDDLAMESFERAEKLGRPSPAAILHHVRLLLNRGEFASAKRLVEQLPQATLEGDLAQAYAEILLNTGDMEEALVIGRKYVEAAPDDADRQLKYGQFLARCANSSQADEAKKQALMNEAGRALQRAAELGPQSPDAWLAVITYHVLSKDMEKALLATQQAQLELADDQLLPFLARCYEIQGQWFNAENTYRTMLRADPDNLQIIQQLATFYLGPGYRRSDAAEKASPLINHILHEGVDGTLPPNNPSLMWARRAAAQLLAASGDYQQLVDAEKLLTSNSQNGSLSVEDRLLTAQILAPRPEPVSRLKAVELLEQVEQNQTLNFQNQLALGQLYFKVGDWRKWRSRMLQVTSSFPSSVEARIAFTRMILQRGDEGLYDEAAKQIKKLQEIAPGNSQTIELMVRLAGKTGKDREVRGYLLRLLPKVSDPQEIDEKQVPLMEFVGTLLVEISDIDSAEKVFRMVAAREPKKQIALAGFLGLHRDVDQCMDLLEENYQPDSAQSIVQAVIPVIRERRDEVGDRYDAQVQAWLDRALLENPDAIPLLMLKAEFADVCKRYDEAGEIYRKLLARKDVTGVGRAIVLNNLAFLVTLAGTEADTGMDPMKLIQEAESILGPTADILDTRAVIHISRKNYQQAIEDLEYSVTDNPTPSKYYHLAVAHLRAGENDLALESWKNAEALGDIRESLNRMEFDQFDTVKAEIDRLRNQDASFTEVDRFPTTGDRSSRAAQATR